MMKIAKDKKTLWIIGAALLLLIAAWMLLRPAGSGPAAGNGTGNPPVAVEVAAIEQGALRDLGNFTGTMTARTKVVVAPKISGRLDRLLVNIGDPVRGGSLIALLDDEEYRQQMIQAEADLRVVKANLEEARSSMLMSERNLERARALHETGITSDAQLDLAISEHQAQQARLHVAEAQLANREAALESARVRLSYTRITAPWDRNDPVRYVGERFSDEGALLSPNTPILSIVELQPIIAVFFITDRDYFRLKVKQQAKVVSNAFPGKSFPGRIARIAPMLQETSRQARVEVETDNPELLLKPGMFVNIEIEFARRQNITIVPFNALAKRNEQQGVFLADLENQTARFVPVQTGVIEAGKVEIVKPETLSGHVVVMGHYLLETQGRIIVSPPAAKHDSTTEKPTSPAGGGAL